jgi:hypothetical protein
VYSLDTSYLLGGRDRRAARNYLYLLTYIGSTIYVLATPDIITPKGILEAKRDLLTTRLLILGLDGELAAIPILLGLAIVL